MTALALVPPTTPEETPMPTPAVDVLDPDENIPARTSKRPSKPRAAKRDAVLAAADEVATLAAAPDPTAAPTHVGLSIQTVNAVLMYLDSRPHSEVRALIDAVTAEAQASIQVAGG